ncbi:hypothetical protein JTE90_005906 [Oedothorax gibbosus]|uniref:Uncharacterized protein n=1 Tax=Oedothorax gibbosus TaxID=931172 RepID=A0AAV6U8Z4_9ARAC|nr:hypothetical protein JTE90_005906 [Oedothorax gibbosus]
MFTSSLVWFGDNVWRSSHWPLYTHNSTLVNNIFENRLDVRKFVCSYRAPIGVSAKYEGVIIAFGSDFIPLIAWLTKISRNLTIFSSECSFFFLIPKVQQS